MCLIVPAVAFGAANRPPIAEADDLRD